MAEVHWITYYEYSQCVCCFDIVWLRNMASVASAALARMQQQSFHNFLGRTQLFESAAIMDWPTGGKTKTECPQTRGVHACKSTLALVMAPNENYSN